MPKIQIASIVGARPQFIKAAVVSRAIRASENVAEQVIHTGQHYDANLSTVFFDELEIPKPDHHLGVGSGPHGYQTARMLEKIEALLLQIRPDCVLVYGDTNSTLAGALAAVKLYIPVAHVEAGLRSFNRNMPEEINRVLTDHSSTFLFAPTDTAVNNLRREGIAEESIHLTGDVMYDAALFYAEKSDKESLIRERHKLLLGPYILATVHRAENTDHRERLVAILEGLSLVAEEVPVVLPLHPRTRAAIEKEDLSDRVGCHLLLMEPLGYLDMVMLEKNAALIATDSGGVQKEAFFYHVPCVTLRDETEWVELIDAGWNRLVPPRSVDFIKENILTMIGQKGKETSLYGGGYAAQEIAHILLRSPIEPS